MQVYIHIHVCEVFLLCYLRSSFFFPLCTRDVLNKCIFLVNTVFIKKSHSVSLIFVLCCLIYVKQCF